MSRELNWLAVRLRAQDFADAVPPLQTRDTIEKYCERFEKDMLRLFDRYYRKGEPKAMAVRLPVSVAASPIADFWTYSALRSNSSRLQWREFVHPDLRQPTRLLHLEGARAGGSWRVGWRCDVSTFLALPRHTTNV